MNRQGFHLHLRDSHAFGHFFSRAKSGDKAGLAGRGFIGCLAKFCQYAVLALTIVALAILSVISLAATVIFRPDPHNIKKGALLERAHLGYEWPSLAFIGSLVLVVIVLLAVGWIFSKLKRAHQLVFLALFLLIAQTVWIISLSGTKPWYPDSAMAVNGGRAWNSGDWKQFAPGYCAPGDQVCERSPFIRKGNLHQYLSWYPFQSGSMLWFAAIFRVFGTGNTMGVQFVNALSIVGAVVLLYLLLERMCTNKRVMGVFLSLIIACEPLFLFASFVYTNATGFCFALAALYLMMQALTAERRALSYLLVLLSFAVGAIGVMIKGTFNIMLIALVLAAVVIALFGHRYLLSLWSLVCFAGAWLSSGLPVKLLESLSGQSFGKGLPKLSWISIGLTDTPPVLPGWWQGIAFDSYFQTHNDYDRMNEIARTTVGDTLQGYINNPAYGFDFFGRKLMTEWAEPTFQTSMYAAQFDHVYPFKDGLVYNVLTGSIRQSLFNFNDVMQSIIYIFALVGVMLVLVHFKKHSQQHVPALLLAISFMGGFTCYLIWEAKSVYTFPFYLLLLPFAAQGLWSLGNAVRHIRVPHRHTIIAEVAGVDGKVAAVGVSGRAVAVGAVSSSPAEPKSAEIDDTTLEK
ncbi:hypothetical protein KIM372_15280 [Bombiscardovia nodaiensis]|uniref:Glycosyltransferase RgtA/B/C/D-like domain-containing protein n=1 Tax=Bombiscardovia nodaiensis TaxID=2932181 RepID=A0ABN6SBX8_9BIFI|nr:hypothetical protein KIM372_15280 [Bombiscardovia nodaiensis]